MAGMSWRRLQQHGLEIAIALAIIYALYALGLFRPTDIGSAKHYYENLKHDLPQPTGRDTGAH
jgi:hypothetical protein